MLFYFTDFSKIVSFSRVIFNFSKITADIESVLLIKENIFWLILALAFSMPVYKKLILLVDRINNANIKNAINTSITISLFIFSIILLVGSSYNPFLYFRF